MGISNLLVLLSRAFSFLLTEESAVVDTGAKWTTSDWLTLGSIIVSAVLSVFTIILAKKANDNAEAANKSAVDATKVAESANKIAEASNELAKEANKNAIKQMVLSNRQHLFDRRLEVYTLFRELTEKIDSGVIEKYIVNHDVRELLIFLTDVELFGNNKINGWEKSEELIVKIDHCEHALRRIGELLHVYFIKIDNDSLFCFLPMYSGVLRSVFEYYNEEIGLSTESKKKKLNNILNFLGSLLEIVPEIFDETLKMKSYLYLG